MDTAPPEIKQELLQAKKDWGFVPNMYRNMANTPALFKAYLHSYDLFRKQSAFSAVEQEIILLTISRYNLCAYCVAAHSTIADKMAGVEWGNNGCDPEQSMQDNK